MNKKISIVLLVLVILAVTGYFIWQKNKKETSEIPVKIQAIDTLKMSGEQNRSFKPNKQVYKITNAKAITVEGVEGDYSAPIWSPDGKNILVSKLGFKGLYLIDTLILLC